LSRAESPLTPAASLFLRVTPPLPQQPGDLNLGREVNSPFPPRTVLLFFLSFPLPSGKGSSLLHAPIKAGRDFKLMVLGGEAACSWRSFCCPLFFSFPGAAGRTTISTIFLPAPHFPLRGAQVLPRVTSFFFSGGNIWVAGASPPGGKFPWMMD